MLPNPQIHPANFAHHFHTDHPVFSCSKIEQKQLNTWVSFQSAEQPLLGQFSVSGNKKRSFACSMKVRVISRSSTSWSIAMANSCATNLS
ncbi:hypothetical protein AO989_32415 [Pseudomonas aeruginosa]|nr:hypothetical protein AO905_33400 [Pseudomonas aeruginosa]KSI67381.2 hypothetical protein AO992_33340 [Pseudomonas aeruginosa]KSJ07973.2 hypothetical protein AO989_32415 [Pseudomonas aeruginosa]